MSGFGRLWARWKFPEQRVWLAVVAWALILLLIVVVAAAGYSGVLLAQTVAVLTPEQSVAFQGTNATGVLQDNGSVTLTLRLTVTNPSDRLLAFSSIAYKSWVEDLPAEAGLMNLGRSDNILVNETGTHSFFKAFLGSFDVTPVLIPAHGSQSVQFRFNLTLASAAARFRAVQNITAYASQVRGDGTGMPWVHWVLVALTFQDLPRPSATSGEYLTNLTRIVFEEGPNLG